MKRAARMVLVAGALASAALAAGCSEERSRGAGALVATREEGSVVEGARIQGRLTRSIQLLSSGGAARAESLPTESFDTRVQHGAAAVLGHGALVALTVRLEPARPLSFVDSAGHRHQLVFESGLDGEPPRAVQASLDGRMLARSEFEWQRSGHGFILRHRSTTVFARGGSPSVREDMSVEGERVASTGADIHTPATPAGQATLVHVAPAAQMLPFCYAEQIYYAFASLAVSVAWETLTRMPYDPKVWVAMGAAIKLWDGALTDLLNCWVS